MADFDFLEASDASVEIIASRQQTRFHLLQDRRSSEISIDKLSLSIRASTASGSTATAGNKSGNPAKGKGKGKAAAAAADKDILIDADVRLKAGVHYGLLGRNGSGKSTFLKALATKVIPGMSLATRIALLQQTAQISRNDDGRESAAGDSAGQDVGKGQSVLEYILSNDDARNHIQDELAILTCTPLQPGAEGEEDHEILQVKAYRRLQLSRKQRRLAEHQKNAALRSGARGSQARKELIAWEKEVEDARLKLEETDISHESPDCQAELAHASQLITELQAELDERPIGDLESRALKVLSHLGFTDAMVQTPLSDLSGGWQMRAHLASTLLQDADVMILDEPTNFLDLLGIVWLQRHLVGLRETEPLKTVLVVSHDRDFIDKVCQEIVLIRDLGFTYFGGNLSAYEEDLRARRLNLTRMKEAQDRQRVHMEKTIATNIRAGKKSGDDNKLRQAVSRQKRLDDRMGMNVSARGGRFKLNRDRVGYHITARAAIEVAPQDKSVNIVLPAAPDLRFPGALISLDNVSFSYAPPPSATVLSHISLSIHPGARVGLLGLNGSGKSTLVKLITDAVTPTKGAVARHPRLRLGYYAQTAVDELRALSRSDPSLTALGMLAREAGGEMDEPAVRALLGSFQLAGDVAARVPVGKLSGGQLVRLALTRVVWKRPHLLVLDEVTTHLDFYTVQALARALRAFDGAVLLVSHNRFFVRAVVEGKASLLGGEEGDDDDESNVEDEGDEAGAARAEMARALYLMKKGSLSRLERGVEEFEESLERRVAKLLAS